MNRTATLASTLIALTLLGQAARAAASTDTAADLADQWVAEKGWTEGWDTRDQRLVVVRTGSIPVPTSSPAFLNARAKAFEEAMAGARQAAVEFLAAEISTEMQAQSDLVQVIGDSELAETMTGAAADDAFLMSSSFADAVNVTANATLVGLTPVQTFVTTTPQGGEVAFVAAWGPR